MANEILTRCGYRCDLCLAFKDNIQKDDRRELLSKGWNKIFGIELKPENIFCEGCLSCKSDLKLIDSECKVRPCVIARGIENCSQCEEFPCEILEDRLVRYAELEAKLDFKVSRNERRNFIEPYENYDRLVNLREKQGPNSRMYNQSVIPTFEDMTKFIGNDQMINLWYELHEYIKKSYEFQQIIRYGGKNYGWVINYRRGTKSIVSIHPERDAFTVLYVFGEKELHEFDMIRNEISKPIVELIDRTMKYHDGKWIWISATDGCSFSDFTELLNIKSKSRL